MADTPNENAGDDNASIAPVLLGVIWSLGTVALAVLVLRLYTAVRIVQRVNPEDYLMLAALVSLDDLAFDFPDNQQSILIDSLLQTALCFGPDMPSHRVCSVGARQAYRHPQRGTSDAHYKVFYLGRGLERRQHSLWAHLILGLPSPVCRHQPHAEASPLFLHLGSGDCQWLDHHPDLCEMWHAASGYVGPKHQGGLLEPPCAAGFRLFSVQ